MRYPPGHKEEVRDRLVTAASHALRRDGLEGVSIPALMKKAGLTHGGFYAHFDNKDALVAAAVDAAADDTAARVLQAPLSGLLDVYLSAGHAARPGDGCVVAALGAEGRRQRGKIKASFARAARGLVQLVHRRLPHAVAERAGGAAGAAVAGGAAGENDTAWLKEPVSDAALDVTARMVGAVVLARLMDDDALAERLLSVVKGRILTDLAPAATDAAQSSQQH